MSNHIKSQMRDWLASLSIRSRLILIIASTVMVIIFAGGFLVIQHDLSRLKQQLIDETVISSKVLAQDFAKLLLVDRADIASDIVSKLSAFPLLLKADLHANDKRLILHYSRDKQDPSPVSLTADINHVWTDELLIIRTPVEYDRTTLGEVIYAVSTEALQSRKESIYRMFAMMLPVTLILVFIASYFLQRSFSKPLMTLARLSKIISNNKDYSLRLEVKDQSEFGQLFAGFNHMLETIQLSSNDLATQKEQLQVTLQSIPDGIITTDKNGFVTYMNSVSEQLSGIEISKASGHPIEKTFRLISSATGNKIVNPVYQCIEQGRTVIAEAESDLLRNDGGKLGVRASAAPIYGNSEEVIGSIAVLVDVTASRALADELNFQASHDSLTSLVNRRSFESKLASALTTAYQQNIEHVLFYMDLDQFKVVNDRCGHAAGDELLKEISLLLRTKVRSGDCLARLGGDEFGIILMNCPAERAIFISEEILSVIGDFRFEWMSETFSIGISIGMTTINSTSPDMNQLLANADAACYQAKESGRNRIYVYKEQDEALTQRRGDMAFVSRLRKFIDGERLQLYCQKIQSLDNHEDNRFHYEILLRMQDENDEIILPGNFMHAAERYGLIEQIDRWVVRNVIQQLSNNPLHLSRLECCSINLSGVSISKPEFLLFIQKQLDDAKEVAPKICFEITETAAIGNISAVKKLLREVGRYGVKFSLDDFGTGMSSLSYLKDLPVDYVKIDGVFIRDIANDPVDWGMVRAINQLAHVMNKKTVAEFVETQEVLDMLKSIDVNFAQGYLLGKPEPLELLLDAHLT